MFADRALSTLQRYLWTIQSISPDEKGVAIMSESGSHMAQRDLAGFLGVSAGNVANDLLLL